MSRKEITETTCDACGATEREARTDHPPWDGQLPHGWAAVAISLAVTRHVCPACKQRVRDVLNMSEAP